MRTLAIGDIHGCLTALNRLLDAVQPQTGDLIITLGDYVDRGPASRGVLDRVIGLSRSHHLVALLGNHDWMMLEARHDPITRKAWLGFGGEEALQSYSGGRGRRRATLDDVPAEHWYFLEQKCVYLHETDTHFYVHGNVDADVPLDCQRQETLIWKRVDDARPHCSGKTMICGHTAQKSGLPLNLGFAVCIDTWVYGDGWLTCLDVGSGAVWQANEDGELRSGSIM